MVDTFREAWHDADPVNAVGAAGAQIIARTAQLATVVFTAMAILQLSSASSLIGWTSAVCAIASAVIARVVHDRPDASRFAANALTGVLFSFGATIGWATASHAIGILFFVSLVPVIALYTIGLRAATGWGLATLGLLTVLAVQRTTFAGARSVAFDLDAMGVSPHRAAGIFLITLMAVLVSSDVARRRAMKQSAQLKDDATRLDEELVTASERYRALVENSRDLIIELDDSGRVVFTSDDAQDLFGSATLIGTDIRQRLAPHERDSIVERVQHALEDRNFALLPEARAQTDGGDWIRFETTVSQYERAGEKRIVLRLRDVTAERELQQQMQQTQKLQAIGQLAGGIAHDFNNLLTVVAGWADEIQADPSVAIEASREIAMNAERGAALTRQLLAFAHKSAYAPRVLDLNEVIRGLCSMLERLVDETFEISMDLAKPLPKVEVDPAMVEQSLVNLVLNARDSMPQGGRIEIRSIASGTGGKGHVSIEVKDHGHGMSDAVAARAFEPFFTTKAVGKGTGLGLAAVHGLTERMGGAVTLESAPDRGTVVGLHFPATARDATPVEPTPDSEATTASNDARILVVEDETAIRELMRSALTSAGYEVEIASDGEDALAKMTRSNTEVDLLVCDVMMPRMSGPDLIRTLRAKHGELKVLFISGYPADETEVFEGSGTAFLPKPFRAKQLVKAVQLQLGSEAG